MPVYFAEPNIQRQGVVAGFVLSAPDYSGTPPEWTDAVSWTFYVQNITVLGQTVEIGTGYQHWVNVGGAVFSYVQRANSGEPNDTDSPTIVAAALANAINEAADALAIATTSGGTLTLTARQNTGAAIPISASTSAYPYNAVQTLYELTGNELVPGITLGVLFAQGEMYMPAEAPTLPAAPASQQSWLYYNSGTGWYWSGSSTPNTSSDACVGWVVTTTTAIVAVSSRRIGTGAEAGIVPAGPGAIAIATGEAGDTGVPPAPSFDAAETSTQLLLGDLAFSSTANTEGIDFAMFYLYYVSETAGTTLHLTTAMTSAATSIGANAALPYSTPGSVTFTFTASAGGLIPIGPGFTHNIEIGAQTYCYVQLIDDTADTIAEALANVINASPDPNAIATASGATVILTAAQNTGASVPCSASDSNTPQNLTETMPSYVAIDEEIVQVNASNGSAVVRGQLGSTAAAHSVGAKIWPVATMSQVFALPPLSYGTPAWPTVVGQIPFTGNALVAAQCWVANEIGPSPTTTECFTGQGPYAVDANGVPLAPDVAAFTATVTANIEIAGQPYYQFSGTVKMALAVGTTAEIDVVMTDANGWARTVYKYFGPFTASATLDWASIPYPQPTTGAGLVFTPTVIPLNTDLTPTVSAQTPANIDVGIGEPGASMAPNVTATCTAVALSSTAFGISAVITLPTSNPNYSLLQAGGSIVVTGGWAGGTASTITTLTGWGSATNTLTITAGTPSGNSFADPTLPANFVVTFTCQDSSGNPAPNPFTVTLAIPGGPAPAMTSATGSVAYSMIGNGSVVNFNGALVVPSSTINLSKVVVQLQVTIGSVSTTTPWVTFSQTDINFVGGGGTLNFGTAYGNVSNGIMQPQTGSNWTISLQYVAYNASGQPNAAVTFETFTVYVQKLTALAVTEGTRSADVNGSTYTQFTLTPTVYESGIYPTGSGQPGNGALAVTVWLSKDGGNTFTWMGVETLPTATSTIQIGNTASVTEVDPTGIGVATVSGGAQWQFAAATGWYNSPAANSFSNAGTGPIAAAALPSAAVLSSLFTVNPVGSPAATDITGISLLTFGSGQPYEWWVDGSGLTVYWTFAGITGTLAGLGVDPNAAFLNISMQQTNAAGTDGTETLLASAQLSSLGAPGGTFNWTPPATAKWQYPPSTYPDLNFRIKVYVASRLNNGTWSAGGNSSNTLQTGWPSSPSTSYGLITLPAVPVTGTQVVNNSMYQAQVSVPPAGNLCPNGNFAQQGQGWTLPSSGSIQSAIVLAPNTYAVEVSAAGTGQYVQIGAPGLPCAPGDQVLIQSWIYSAAGATGYSYCSVNFFNAAGTELLAGSPGEITAAASAGAWGLAQAPLMTAPAGAASYHVQGMNTANATGTWYLGAVIITKSPAAINGAPNTAGGSMVPGTVTGGSGGSIATTTITGGASGNIVSTTITYANVANSTLTGTQIGSNTITGGSGNIASTTITYANVANSTLTGTQIGSNTITGGSGNIASTTVTYANVANNTLTASQIGSNTITGGSTGNIASTAITYINVAGSTLTTNQVASSTLTGGSSGNLASSTVTGGNVANATLVTGNVANATLVAGNIANATITATQIASLTITDGNIASVNVSKLVAGSASFSGTATFADQGGASVAVGGGEVVVASSGGTITLSSGGTATFLSGNTQTTIAGNQILCGALDCSSLAVLVSTVTVGGVTCINASGAWTGGMPAGSAPSTTSGSLTGSSYYGSNGVRLGTPAGWLSIGGHNVPYY
jgi:hypothetical protein